MRKFNQIIISVLFCSLIFTAISCELGIDDIPRQKELESITVDTKNAVTKYVVGSEKLIENGLKIIGHYSDGSEKEEDIEYANITGFDSETEGIKTIKVEFGGKSTEYNITIGADTPCELIIANYPKQLIYWRTDNDYKYDGLELKLKKKSGDFDPVSLNDDVEISTNPIDQKSHTITVTIKHRTYQELWRSFYLYVFDYDECWDEKGKSELKIIDNISLEKYGNLQNLGYKKDEEINFSGLSIDIKNKYTGAFLYRIPANEVHIPIKTFSEEIINNGGKASVIINDQSLYIPLNAIDKYITGAVLEIDEENFIKNNYKGKTVDFTDEGIFQFYRIFDDGKSSLIEFQEKEIQPVYSDKGESIFYCTSINGQYISVKEPYLLNTLGNNTLYFKYKFYSFKSGHDENCIFTKTFYVQDAKLSYITAEYKYKDTEKNYLEYSINDENVKNQIKLENIYVFKTDTSKFAFPLDVSNITFKCNKPNPSSFTKDNMIISGSIEISCRIGSDTLKGTLDNVLFYKYVK